MNDRLPPENNGKCDFCSAGVEVEPVGYHEAGTWRPTGHLIVSPSKRVRICKKCMKERFPQFEQAAPILRVPRIKMQKPEAMFPLEPYTVKRKRYG